MGRETDSTRPEVSKSNMERVNRHANEHMAIQAESVGFDKRLAVVLDALEAQPHDQPQDQQAASQPAGQPEGAVPASLRQQLERDSPFPNRTTRGQ